MVRTQIQLTEDQSHTLKALAAARDVSVAELIRQSVDRLIRAADEPTLDERWQRTLSIVGKYRSGVPDLGQNHDFYLAQIYAETGE